MKLDIDEIHEKVKALYGTLKANDPDAPPRNLPSSQVRALMEVLVEAINQQEAK